MQNSLRGDVQKHSVQKFESSDQFLTDKQWCEVKCCSLRLEAELVCIIPCLSSQPAPSSKRSWWKHRLPRWSALPGQVLCSAGPWTAVSGQSVGAAHLPCTCSPPSQFSDPEFSLLCCQAFSWKHFHVPLWFPLPESHCSSLNTCLN